MVRAAKPPGLASQQKGTSLSKYDSTVLGRLPGGPLVTGNVLNENSGFQLSRTLTDSNGNPVLWVVEDGTSTNDTSPNVFLYALSLDGTLLKAFQLAGTGMQLGQWEDLAYDADSGVLWVPNCGNNTHTNDTFRAVSFPEPTSLANPGVVDTIAVSVYEFAFDDAPAGGWNCETMFCDPEGNLHFVTKEAIADAGLYRIDKVSLLTWSAASPVVNTLVRVAGGTGWAQAGHYTGGDMTPDGSAFYLMNASAEVFMYDGAAPYAFVEQAQLHQPQTPAGVTPTAESLAIAPDGSYGVISSEGGRPEIVRFDLTAAPVVNVLSDGDFATLEPKWSVNPSNGLFAISRVARGDGTYFGALAAAEAGNPNLDSEPFVVAAGDVVDVQVTTQRLLGVDRNVRLDVRCMDATGTPFDTIEGSGVTSTDQEQVVFESVTIPAGAATAVLRIVHREVVAGDVVALSAAVASIA